MKRWKQDIPIGTIFLTSNVGSFISWNRYNNRRPAGMGFTHTAMWSLFKTIEGVEDEL